MGMYKFEHVAAVSVFAVLSVFAMVFFDFCGMCKLCLRKVARRLSNCFYGLPISESELEEAYAGKSILVCGASTGIGEEIAYSFARAHARIVIAAPQEDKL